MAYHCPFDHLHSPIPEEIRESLEQGISGILDPAQVPKAEDAILSKLRSPILDLFLPWAELFQEAGTGIHELRSRVVHQAVEEVAELLNQGELADEMGDMLRDLRERDPRMDPGFRDLPLLSRAQGIRQFEEESSRLLEGFSQAMKRILIRSLPRLLEKLLGLAREYRAGHEAMRDAFGKSSGLQDLDPGHWAHHGLTRLQESSAILAREKGLHELLETLGRRAVLDPRYSEQRRERENRQIESGASLDRALGRQELEGLRQGRELETLIPSELAFLKHKESRKRFFLNYAEEKLLSFDYLERERAKEASADQGHQGRSEADLGPFILCLDSSGSMVGVPEALAKALSLAAIQRALSQARRLFLLCFSTGVQVLRVDGKLEPGAYLDLLAHSFRGGTDLRPALKESLKVIREEGWTDADLLIVSDFQVPKIMLKKSRDLRGVQETFGTRIHALTIAPQQILDDYNLFDSRWHCLPDPPELGPRVLETD